jgi:Domain of unknown function (DUF4372)
VSGFCSMFSQLLKLFPRTEFQALVKRTHAERHARGFSCWGQFVAMLFCQLGRAHSLQYAPESRSTGAPAGYHQPGVHEIRGGTKEMLLYSADNGAVRDGKTRLSVTVAYAHGTKKEIAVERK